MTAFADLRRPLAHRCGDRGLHAGAVRAGCRRSATVVGTAVRLTAMDTPFDHVLTTVDELRELYRQPSRLVQGKKVGTLDDATRTFIAASPFVLLATAAADGSCDVSPRGGPPGFVRALDDRRLALPDLSGNNLLDSLVNLTSNPHVGLLFLLPGRDETLRVDGRAWVTVDPTVLELWDERAVTAEDRGRGRGGARLHPLRQVLPPGPGVGPVVVGGAGCRAGRLRAAGLPHEPRRGARRRQGQPGAGLRPRPGRRAP